MSQKEYRLFGANPYVDPSAANRLLYLTKQFESYNQRIYLLESGALALVDYVDYGAYELPHDVLNGKLVGKGVGHYVLNELAFFDSLAEAVRHPVLLKSKLINMSQVLVRRNSYTGYYELVQGKDIDDIFEAAKA
jgi:hypothetical protein